METNSQKHLMRGDSGKRTGIPDSKDNVDLEHVVINKIRPFFITNGPFKKFLFYAGGNCNPKRIKVSKFIVDLGFKLGFPWLQSQYFSTTPRVSLPDPSTFCFVKCGRSLCLYLRQLPKK